MFKRLKWRWRLLEISIRLTSLEKMLESVPIFWNFQYMKLPKETRKTVMGWMEEVHELGIEEANLLLNLGKYDLHRKVIENVELAEKNIKEVKQMCDENGVSYC